MEGGVTIEEREAVEIDWYERDFRGSIHLEWLPPSVRKCTVNNNMLLGLVGVIKWRVHSYSSIFYYVPAVEIAITTADDQPIGENPFVKEWHTALLDFSIHRLPKRGYQKLRGTTHRWILAVGTARSATFEV